MTHVGPHRVFARIHDPSGTAGAVHLRLEWFAGDATRPTDNEIVSTPLVGNYALVELGEIMPRKARVGAQTWLGRVLAKADTAGADINVDKLYVLPTGEGYGKIIASADLPTPTTFSARDEFDQSAGALTGKTAPVGGTWAGAGDSDDFSVETTGKTAQRTAVSDSALTNGRFATLPISLAGLSARVDVKASVTAAASATRFGLLARYVDTSNYLLAALVSDTANRKFDLVVLKRVAGSSTTLASVATQLEKAIFHTIGLSVGETGVWSVTVAGTERAAGSDPDLATGGALETGAVGIYDAQTSAVANTRNYDSLAAWAPETDAVLYADQTAQLGTDGYWRQTADGKAWAPIVPEGDLPRQPLGGLETRSTEWFFKMSQGDLGSLPDSSATDAPSVRILHRPSWLFPPR